MEDYEFVVWKKNKFSFARIVREFKKDNPNGIGFLLTTPGFPNAVVCLRQKFLKKFTADDNVVVAGEHLDPYWGLEETPTIYDEAGTGMMSSYAMDTDIKTKNIRVAFIHVSEIARVIVQIQKARESLCDPTCDGVYKERDTVKVKVKAL